MFICFIATSRCFRDRVVKAQRRGHVPGPGHLCDPTCRCWWGEKGDAQWVPRFETPASHWHICWPTGLPFPHLKRENTNTNIKHSKSRFEKSKIKQENSDAMIKESPKELRAQSWFLDGGEGFMRLRRGGEGSCGSQEPGWLPALTWAALDFLYLQRAGNLWRVQARQVSWSKETCQTQTKSTLLAGCPWLARPTRWRTLPFPRLCLFTGRRGKETYKDSTRTRK